MPYADVNPELDTADAISGMADVLDQAAEAVTTALQSEAPVSGSPLRDPRIGPHGDTGAGDTFDPAVLAQLERDSGAGGYQEPEAYQQGLQTDQGGIDPLAQKADFMAADLGDQPSLQALEAAISSGGSPTGGDPTMGGGPADMIAGLMGEGEVAEETTPGADAATFLSDFNRGMSAQSPEQGLVAKIDALQDQAAQLQAQASGFDPSAAVAGGAPAQPISPSWEMERPETDWRMFLSPLEIAQERVDDEGAAGGWGGNAGWRNPNLDAFSQLEQVGINPLDQKAAYMAANPLGANKAGMWNNPNTAFTPLENPNYPAWQNPNTVRPPLESPNYPAWQNPNTVRPPLEGANFPPDWYNVNEQIAYPTAMGGNLPVSAEQAAATATGGGQGWVDPNTVVPNWYNVNEQIPYPTAMGGNLPVSAEQAAATVSGGGQGWIDPNITEQQAATTIAPKYSGETVGYQTHEQMYPGHKDKAAMVGVASIISMFDGTHKAWIDAINDDMEKRDIVLDHEINGVKTGKHSSGNWKEYDALFTVGADGVPRDSNGVTMPGTEKQAQAGMGGVLQTLFGGVLSGAQNLFQPKTSSGVAEPALLETGATTFGEDYDRPEPVRVAGDDTRGDNEIDIIRSNYAWAASLPRSVLFNALRYPDYLRLLIEYDADGKDLPLTVPTWILEGTARPAEDNGEDNGATPHYAQQQELTWPTPSWLT